MATVIILSFAKIKQTFSKKNFWIPVSKVDEYVF